MSGLDSCFLEVCADALLKIATKGFCGNLTSLDYFSDAKTE